MLRTFGKVFLVLVLGLGLALPEASDTLQPYWDIERPLWNVARS